jgi:hypothetical protein
MQAVVAEVVADIEAITHVVAETVVVEAVAVVGIEEVLQAHAMACQEKVADTKVTVIAQHQAETAEIHEMLVPHVLLVAIEVRAAILLPKKVQAHEVRAELLVRHEATLQERLEVMLPAQTPHVLQERLLETPTKKTNF